LLWNFLTFLSVASVWSWVIMFLMS
jgi:hypothetical protein